MRFIVYNWSFETPLAHVALPGVLVNMKSVDAALLRECIAAAPAGKLDQFLADMASAGIASLNFILHLFIRIFLLDPACLLITDIDCMYYPGLSPTRETAGAMVRKLAHAPGVDVALGKYHL